MSFTAVVKNGAILLPPGVHLADGTMVTVAEAEVEVSEADSSTDSLAALLEEFTGCIDSGVGDIAENHDHYAHGSPKGVDRG